ncbi:MAG: trigger factor [Candidatus Harrisonbacteria bacterium]|nr:trigger factor [Candidatus Harrisonbacteria bacterium]
MKYTSKKLPNSIVEAEVILGHQEFLNYYQPVYDQALSVVHLKGFRPGTAPKDLADKAVDKEKVFNEAVNKAVRDALQEINAENNWQLIDQPKVEVLESEPAKDIGLKFKITLTVFPEVKLGNYQKLVKKILHEDPKEIFVSEDELNKSINWVLNSRAKLTRVNREAKKGDVVDIDFSGFLDGKALDGASGKADNFVLGEGKFIPGFEDNIVNHKEGENLEFSVNFPTDYWKEDLRDKKIGFKVSLKGVFEKQMPELTDEFIKGLGNFQTVEEFKNSIREGMKKEKEGREKERVRLKIMNEMVKNSQIDSPQIMIDKTLDNLVNEYRATMQPPSGGKLEDDASLRKRFEERAKHDVAANLVAYQIAKDQKIEPTPDEVEAEVNKFLTHSQFSKRPKIDPQRLYDYSYGVVQNRKVFEYLESLK